MVRGNELPSRHTLYCQRRFAQELNLEIYVCNLNKVVLVENQEEHIAKGYLPQNRVDASANSLLFSGDLL